MGPRSDRRPSRAFAPQSAGPPAGVPVGTAEGGGVYPAGWSLLACDQALVVRRDALGIRRRAVRRADFYRYGGRRRPVRFHPTIRQRSGCSRSAMIPRPVAAAATTCLPAISKRGPSSRHAAAVVPPRSAAVVHTSIEPGSSTSWSSWGSMSCSPRRSCRAALFPASGTRSSRGRAVGGSRAVRLTR